MLVLTRKNGEAIRIGKDIEVRILDIHGGRVRLGLCAPPEVDIQRDELRQRGEDCQSVLQLSSSAWRRYATVGELCT
jgi:carbon storage regulator